MSELRSPLVVRFEYRYRDACNFKADGYVALIGSLSQADRDKILDRLDDGQFFIAEQVGIPVLYEELYKWGGGPNSSDHCWHEFVAFNDAPYKPRSDEVSEDASHFLKRFCSVVEWCAEISPHFLQPPLVHP